MAANLEIEDLDQLLRRSVAEGNYNEMEVLFQMGVNVNKVIFSTNEGEMTPLHMAVKVGRKEIVKLLLQNGANPNLDEEGAIGFDSPFHSAIQRKKNEIALLLMDYGANINRKYVWERAPLRSAIEENNVQMTKALILKGAIVDEEWLEPIDDEDRSHLQYAIELGAKEDILEMLIGSGADMNRKTPGPSIVDTPLHLAVRYKNGDGIKTLLKYGADPNLLNIEEDDQYVRLTPAELALENKFTDIAKIFLYNQH